MNINGMIKRLRGRNYTVTRSNSNGAYSTETGLYQAGATVKITVLGSLQPATPEDIVSLPEGDRTKESFRFYSLSPLQNNDTPRLRRGDLVSVSGVNYRVENVEHWPTHGKSVIVRENTSAN